MAEASFGVGSGYRKPRSQQSGSKLPHSKAACGRRRNPTRPTGTGAASSAPPP